ncbi:MAG: FKBP-type peptidyl-prolyl cis-trans isomerase [Candidatus Marinimicrobia bacterium]|nr:FKBP-type peptidyl-prolyl cis-trans isomerase [Candidatus Neomarinimicrobiota bacterium]
MLKLKFTLPVIIVAIILSGCGKKGEKQTYDNGLVVIDSKIGEGDPADGLDILEVNYVGKLDDGSIFDKSNQPFKFTLGAGWVIEGWEQGLLGLRVGGKRTLIIPPELAYGTEGFGDAIPPNATLTFDIELVGLEKF